MDLSTYLLAIKTSKKYTDSVIHNGILVATVTNGGSFPTTRPDGSALKNEDYVKPATSSTFPFTIGTVTFDNRFTQAVYYNGEWLKDAGAIPDTSEVPLKNQAAEGITGLESLQSQLNINIKAELLKRAEKGDVSTITAEASKLGAIYIQTVDVSGTPSYTKGHIYVCVQNGATYEWLDAYAVDDVTVEFNASKQLQIKDEGVTLPKFAKQTTDKAGFVYTIDSDGTTKVARTVQYKRVSALSTETGNVDTFYYLDTDEASYRKGTYIWDSVTNDFISVGGKGEGSVISRVIGTIAVGDLECTVVIPKGTMVVDAQAFLGSEKVIADVDVTAPSVTSDGSVKFSIREAQDTPVTCYAYYSDTAASSVHRVGGFIAVGGTSCVITLPADKRFMQAQSFVGTEMVLTDVDVVHPTPTVAGSVTFSIADPHPARVDCFAYYTD